MTRWNGFTIALALLGLVWASPAAAQPAASQTSWNFNAGGLTLEDADTEVLYGTRLYYRLPSGWGIGGSVSFAQADLGRGDANLYLYYGELQYAVPTDSQWRFLLTGGLGAATTSPDGELEEAGLESNTNFALPLGAGVEWVDDPADPTWSIRMDVRDHIIFGSDGEEVAPGSDGQPAVDFQNDTTNNWEYTAGVSFFIG